MMTRPGGKVERRGEASREDSNALFPSFSTYLLLGPRRATPLSDLRTIRKLAVRTTNWIGDAVMTTPALGALRGAFPEAEIVIIANPVVGELFSHHPFCDRVLIFDKKKTHKGLGGLWGFIGMLRSERFQLAVLFQNAIEAAILAFLGGIPHRGGYRTDCRGVLLTHGAPVGPAERRMHHTEYYLNMLRAIGVHGGDQRLALSCSAEEVAWAGTLLEEKAGDGWLAINPGAAYGSAKRWLPERFAAVADALASEYRWNVLLTGGAAEAEIGQAIQSAMKMRPLNMVGKTSVRQLMALLSRCRLMVTNDSGPMHMAAAFDVPIVALFGSTDHTTTSPLCTSRRIVRKPFQCAPCLLRQCPTDHRCMSSITVEDVLDAVKSMSIPTGRL